MLHAERVARVVVGDALEPRPPRRRTHEPLVVQELHHVANPARERTGLVGPDQVAELLQVRAASGRVHDDDVDAGEGAQVALGEGTRGVQASVVGGERPAARLVAWDDDAPAIARQHADRGAVHLAEPPVLHAPTQQRDGAPLVTGRGGLAGEAAEEL
jgi:hypothetical protein